MLCVYKYLKRLLRRGQLGSSVAGADIVSRKIRPAASRTAANVIVCIPKVCVIVVQAVVYEVDRSAFMVRSCCSTMFTFWTPSPMRVMLVPFRVAEIPCARRRC